MSSHFEDLLYAYHVLVPERSLERGIRCLEDELTTNGPMFSFDRGC